MRTSSSHETNAHIQFSQSKYFSDGFALVFCKEEPVEKDEENTWYHNLKILGTSFIGNSLFHITPPHSWKDAAENICIHKFCIGIDGTFVFMNHIKGYRRTTTV